MHADSPPMHPLGIPMRAIETMGFFPIQTELMLVASGGDVRMAAGLDVGIHANRNGRQRSAAPGFPRRFFEECFQLGWRLNVEENNSAAGAPAGRPVRAGFGN